MKNLGIHLLAFFVIMSRGAMGQSVNIESAISADTSAHLGVLKTEVQTSIANFRYDYKATASDVLGVTFPKIWSDSITKISGMVVKIGDEINNQFAFDGWVTSKINRFSVMGEVGRMIGKNQIPWDYVGMRVANKWFTAEAYGLGYHPVHSSWDNGGVVYAWAAYHPEHLFVSAGVQVGRDYEQYWGFVGTKNIGRFGNFSFVNYDVKTGNFWFRTQSGFGEINDKFFCQDLYIEATSYMVVPIFFYKHFSPISTKGTYALKIDGRRVGNVDNYELIISKNINHGWLAVATGINSELIDGEWRFAPSLEAYKCWNTKDRGSLIVEFRYDVLYKTASAYLVVRY
ncbi:MAG: hypothetical protein PHG95_01685 [Patescibacteria group bacterium]|nr:hypothetical protein [Patescibacteria group bacterium]